MSGRPTSEHAPKTSALLAYQAELLSDAGVVRIERHLSTCPTCREELAAIRAYEGLREDVVAAPPPRIDWSRMELAIRREARLAARAQRGPNRGMLMGALAAAAVVALAFVTASRGPIDPIGTGTKLEPPRGAPVAAATGLVDPDRATVTGIITLLAGSVAIDETPAHIDHRVAEGAHVVTGAASRVDVALDDGTFFRLGSEAEIRLVVSRAGQTRLVLERGTVSQMVRELAIDYEQSGPRVSDFYEVVAGDYTVRVRGTRFAVSRNGALLGVSVDEGVVEVLRGGTIIERLVAPASFRSGGGIGPAVRVELPSRVQPRGGAVLSLADLGTYPRWEVAGEPLTGVLGALAMRVLPGEVSVRAWNPKDELFRTVVMVGPSGSFVETRALEPDAPPVRYGTLAPELIQPVVRAGLPALKRCYERSLRQESATHGRLSMRVTLNMTGDVSRVRITDADPDATSKLPGSFIRCLEEEVSSWVFPPPRGGIVTFDLPLRLSSR